MSRAVSQHSGHRFLGICLMERIIFGFALRRVASRTALLSSRSCPGTKFLCLLPESFTRLQMQFSHICFLPPSMWLGVNLSGTINQHTERMEHTHWRTNLCDEHWKAARFMSNMALVQRKSALIRSV